MVATRVVVLAFVAEFSASTACTAADRHTLANTDVNDLGKKANQCGAEAFSLLTGGFDHEKFNSCFTKMVPISPTCSECYAETAEYGAKNCKAACLLGWCKQGCLECTAPATMKVAECVGKIQFEPVTPCLELTEPAPGTQSEYEILFDGCCRGANGRDPINAGQKSIEGCEAACEAESDCIAVEVNGCNDSAQCGGDCWLFFGDNPSDLINGKCNDSGDQKCLRRTNGINTSYKYLFDGCCRGANGRSPEDQGLKNLEQCQAACDADEQCMAMEVNGCNENPACGGTCWLFFGDNFGKLTQGDQCITSGDQKCYEKTVQVAQDASRPVFMV